jgi:hypothetical protein
VRIYGVAASVLAVGGSSPVISASSAANTRPRTAVTLSQPLPSLVRQGTEVTVAGAVRHPPRRGKATLESKRAGGWEMLASTLIRKHGAFTLAWRVASTEPTGPLSLRVVAQRRGGLVVAATAAEQSWIGLPADLCAPPVPPAVEIPVGDGWIVGGRYNEGGAYPGIKACDSQPYTVTATDSGGHVQATQNVAGGHRYTLVVPAGTYTLKSDFCSGTATVTAGKQTSADTICPVP